MIRVLWLRAQRWLLLWWLAATGWRWCPRLSAKLEQLDEALAERKRETVDGPCLERRLQAVEQDLAEHRREMAEALRLGRRLQAHGDAHLWEKIEGLSEEVKALRAERTLQEDGL